jgi:hypothetical protein
MRGCYLPPTAEAGEAVNLLPHNKYEWLWAALTLAGFLGLLAAIAWCGWLYLVNKYGGL